METEKFHSSRAIEMAVFDPMTAGKGGELVGWRAEWQKQFRADYLFLWMGKGKVEFRAILRLCGM